MGVLLMQKQPLLIGASLFLYLMFVLIVGPWFFVWVFTIPFVLYFGLKEMDIQSAKRFYYLLLSLYYVFSVVALFSGLNTVMDQSKSNQDIILSIDGYVSLVLFIVTGLGLLMVRFIDTDGSDYIFLYIGICVISILLTSYMFLMAAVSIR